MSDRSPGSGSIAFDRAAEYYDATRVVGEDAARRQTELLLSELRARGRVLEIGVGTGQISLPLHEAGVAVVGLDLSEPMLAKLLKKAGGRPPFPLVRGDGTRLPFADDAFGGVVMRWVLHLIPAWRDVVAEVARVVRPGGIALVNHGGFSGIGIVLRERMQELVGRVVSPAGLDWGSWRELEAEMRHTGATPRRLEPIVEHSDEPLARGLDDIEAGRYSWTWALDEQERIRAARRLRTWARERYGSLDAPFPQAAEVIWHAYDLGGAGSPGR